MRVKQGLEQGISGDFLAQDIREVLHHIGSITGQISTDEILGNIFKNFCIGK
jgi:tRNA modification GTPase